MLRPGHGVAEMKCLLFIFIQSACHRERKCSHLNTRVAQPLQPRLCITGLASHLGKMAADAAPGRKCVLNQNALEDLAWHRQCRMENISRRKYFRTRSKWTLCWLDILLLRAWHDDRPWDNPFTPWNHGKYVIWKSPPRVSFYGYMLPVVSMLLHLKGKYEAEGS
jgi:hypothetical protein